MLLVSWCQELMLLQACFFSLRPLLHSHGHCLRSELHHFFIWAIFMAFFLASLLLAAFSLPLEIALNWLFLEECKLITMIVKALQIMARVYFSSPFHKLSFLPDFVRTTACSVLLLLHHSSRSTLSIISFAKCYLLNELSQLLSSKLNSINI